MRERDSLSEREKKKKKKKGVVLFFVLFPFEILILFHFYSVRVDLTRFRAFARKK